MNKFNISQPPVTTDWIPGSNLQPPTHKERMKPKFLLAAGEDGAMLLNELLAPTEIRQGQKHADCHVGTDHVSGEMGRVRLGASAKSRLRVPKTKPKTSSFVNF